MIITKKVKIKNSTYYKNKGFISNSQGFVELVVEDLAPTSRIEITAKCDFCDAQKKISFFNYKKNELNQNMFSCSKKCSLIKTKITNLKKYGVENPIQNKEIQEKIKQSNLDKYGVENISQIQKVKELKKETTFKNYGVENPIQNKEIQEKIKQTNLEKYGVENPLQNKYVKNKIKETNLDKYGVENPFQNKDIKEKIKQTNLEKYGVENPFQNKEIQENIKQTNLDKYGVDNYRKTDECSNKIKETNLEKYGVEYGLQNNEIKQKSKKTILEKYGVDNFKRSEISKLDTIIGQHPNYIKYINNSISLFNCDLDKDHEFEIKSDNFLSRLKQNIPLCTICYPIGDNKSIKEKILLEYIQSIYSGEVISGYRDGIEIDIYLPELKIGIEFNGLYWHSNKFKEPNYHINKLNYFKEKGINIKFIYEDDFDNNLNIIKSQINNWLGLSNKIYARKTVIKQIKSVDEYRDFLNNNHIQGYVASKLAYGLYHQDQLVSLMSFDKKEGRLNMPNNEWNLNRFCNLLNHNIVGGASKLLNHFIKENNPSRIISYADKDWSNGNLYDVLGFKLVSESKPDYKYIVDDIRKSKQNFTKAKLSKLDHDISLTESQIMENLGINRIYDCGKMKFELQKI
jgi:hypothetical protein